MSFLKVNKSPVQVGDLMRPNSSGNRLYQVLSIVQNGVGSPVAQLITAGKVTGGKFTPSTKSQITSGEVNGHMVLVEGNSTIQVYTKVDCAEQLEGLPIPAGSTMITAPAWSVAALQGLVMRYLKDQEGSELDDPEGPDYEGVEAFAASQGWL